MFRLACLFATSLHAAADAPRARFGAPAARSAQTLAKRAARAARSAQKTPSGPPLVNGGVPDSLLQASQFGGMSGTFAQQRAARRAARVGAGGVGGEWPTEHADAVNSGHTDFIGPGDVKGFCRNYVANNRSNAPSPVSGWWAAPL